MEPAAEEEEAQVLPEELEALTAVLDVGAHSWRRMLHKQCRLKSFS
jgi:hypothetical protein